MSKIIDQIKKDKILLYIWSKISELWDYSKFLLIVAVIILMSTLIFYNDIAYWLFGNTDESKGKLLTLLLSIVGAIVVVYGLKINSRRLKQGNKQLEQQEENNTNTRFKDAIVLLGNDNPAVVLGGIHSLNQIAIDYPEYSEVISKILCSYIRVLCDKLEGTQSYNNYISVFQLIVDYVFTDIYSEFVLDFSDVYFENIKFKNQILPNIIIDGCRFYNCQFMKLNLSDNLYQNISFSKCKFNYVQFLQTKMRNVSFSHCLFSKEFIDIYSLYEKVSFMQCHFKNIDISFGHFFELVISKSTFDGGKFVNNTFDYGCTIEDNHFVKVTFDNSEIKTNYINNKFKDCNDQIDN